ncbi:hypothetical protein KQI84_13550 [bacterium]|nr:hypothetical protein [bacterium]
MRPPSQHNLDTIWGHEPLRKLVRRLVETDRVPHAMLLHGPDAVGKRSLAFGIAKLILSSGLPIEDSSIQAPDAAPMRVRGFEPDRSPDDDLFGGMDDMFGEEAPDMFGDAPEEPAPPAAEPEPPPPEPEPAPAPVAKKKKAKPKTAPAPEPVRRGPVEIDRRVDKLVAKSYPVNYDSSGRPIMEGFVDLNIIEPADNSKVIKVEQIRTFQDVAALPPIEGRYRVIMVFGADTISVSAANSLLKWLEEPPSYLVMILVTNHYYRVLETIRSRCASLLCHPVEREALAQRLIEDESAEPELAHVAAALSEGRPGLAVEILSGAFLKKRRDVFEARLAIDRHGAVALPMAVDRALASGDSISQAAVMLLSMARDRMVRRLAPGDDRLLVNGDLATMLDEVELEPEHLFAEAERLLDAMRADDHPAVPASQLPLELALWPE